jgi:hypothetical protein
MILDMIPCRFDWAGKHDGHHCFTTITTITSTFA